MPRAGARSANDGGDRPGPSSNVFPLHDLRLQAATALRRRLQPRQLSNREVIL
jgi:hypothetical protein